MVLQSSACSWFSDANLCARRGSFEVHDCKSKYYLVFITKQIELQSHIPLWILLKPLSLFHLLCKKTYTKVSTLQRLHNTLLQRLDVKKDIKPYVLASTAFLIQ